MQKKRLKIITILAVLWITNTINTDPLHGKNTITCRLNPFTIAEKAYNADVVDIDSNHVLWMKSKEDEEDITVFTLYYFDSQTKKTSILFNGRDFRYAKIKNGLIAAVFYKIEMNEERIIREVLKIRKVEGDADWQMLYETSANYNRIHSLEIRGTQQDPLIYFYDSTDDEETILFSKMMCWDRSNGIQILNEDKSFKTCMIFAREKIFFEDNRSGDFDIWAYDSKTKQAHCVVKAPGDQYFTYQWECNEVIGNDFIVWIDSLHRYEQAHNNFDIYGTDLSSEKTFPIAVSVNREDYPIVIGNTVYWLDTYYPPDIDYVKIVPTTKVMSLDYQTGQIKEITTPKTYKSALFANAGYLIWNEEVYSSIRTEFTTDIGGYSFLMNACFPVCNSEKDENVQYINRNHMIWISAENGLYDPMNILSSDLMLCP